MNKYDEIIQKVNSIINLDIPLISNLSNLSRVIYESFENTCWAGFYLYNKEKEELYLGPFQGPVACTIIKNGRGVCGTSVENKKSILVEDVHKFKGHIACYSLSLSEVVVPIFNGDDIFGVIDLDSTFLANYTSDDVIALEKISKIIELNLLKQEK